MSKNPMKPEHVAICEKYIKHWHQLKYTQTVYGIDLNTVRELKTVLKDHVHSAESICEWCPESVAYLIRAVYQAYEQDAPNPIMESVLKTVTEYPNGKPKNETKTRTNGRKKNQSK